MKKTMMYLPEEMHRYLARESAERGVSMAEVAREAISEYRAVREKRKPTGVASIVGVITDDEESRDLAVSVDESLADYYGSGAWEVAKGIGGTD